MMNRAKKMMRVAALVTGSLALAGAWLLHAQGPNFTGGAPKRVEQNSEGAIAHLDFPPGVRSKWHSHEKGQIVFVEEGVGLVQERGGPIIELHEGEVIYAKPGVVHWHGAAPDRGGVQFNVTRGMITWLEDVSDADYKGPTKRLAALPK